MFCCLQLVNIYYFLLTLSKKFWKHCFDYERTLIAEMFFIDQEITSYSIWIILTYKLKKIIKNSLHLVPTKFYQWNEFFARSLWSLALLWDHFVLKGCKSRCSPTTLCTLPVQIFRWQKKLAASNLLFQVFKGFIGT